MDDFNTLKQNATNLRKQKSFKEAAAAYQMLWENFQAECNEWEGWGYAFSLRKAKNVELAYQISQQVFEKWPDFPNNRGVLAWCIFDMDVDKDAAEISPNESNYFGAVNKILKLVVQDTYSPYSRTIFKVIDYLEESRVNFPADLIKTWLDKLDSTKLSTACGQGIDQKGQPMEHASDLEKWYAKKCKALFELGQYQECIDTGLEALKLISSFHYHNDKWIKREIGRSYGELGNSDEGLKWFAQFMDSRAEWFLNSEIANLFHKNGDPEKALKYAAQAALMQLGPELKMKVNLFSFMGEVLLGKGELEYSRKHLLLSARIRTENEWKIPAELQALMDQADVDLSDATASRDLERELGKYWQSLMYSGMQQSSGVIKNLVPTGKSGFISGDDKKEYYFRVNEFHGKPALIKPGLRVAFYIQPSNQPGQKDTAINVTFVDK
jgi:tetratricopeptide (TPR) repeat protein